MVVKRSYRLFKDQGSDDYYDKGYFVIVSGVAYKKKWRNDLRNFL